MEFRFLFVCLQLFYYLFVADGAESDLLMDQSVSFPPWVNCVSEREEETAESKQARKEGRKESI